MAQLCRGGDQHLEVLAVGDHVQHAAVDGNEQDEAYLLGLADDDIAVEIGVSRDLALSAAAGVAPADR